MMSLTGEISVCHSHSTTADLSVVDITKIVYIEKDVIHLKAKPSPYITILTKSSLLLPPVLINMISQKHLEETSLYLAQMSTWFPG